MSIPISPRTQATTLAGPAGLLECAWDLPAGFEIDNIKGAAVVAHPHPLHQGSMDNKVVHTMTRALLQLGYMTWRFNFRGVSQSEGEWDDGRGELADMMSVINHVQSLIEGKPLVLAGFSFGGYIASKATETLIATGTPIEQLVLAGVAADRYDVPNVPKETLVIHGEQDDVVSLESVLNWARPQSLPLVVIPGVGHFFHGQLPLLRDIILKNWSK